MENIKTPISKVAAALKVRSEGVSLRSTARILGSHKRTIAGWENRFADQKATLMLYAFCHKFVSLTFEGDELYTIVGKRTDPMESKGWTAVVMDRASRFIYKEIFALDTDLRTLVTKTASTSPQTSLKSSSRGRRTRSSRS